MNLSPELSPDLMVAHLRSGVLDCRTGLLLLPLELLGKAADLAVTLGVSPVDYHAWKLERIGPGERFLRFSPESLLGELHALCLEPHPLDTVLVSNFDLALSALNSTERAQVWRFLRDGFRKKARGLLLTMPQDADMLLPPAADLQRWNEGGRLSLYRPELHRFGFTDSGDAHAPIRP